MLAKYLTIKDDAQSEIEIKKSRFICSLKRVAQEEEAKAFIQEIKKAHWKANHNCSAFVIGDHYEIQRSSDDGEPSGTAGVPMLEVLKKKQLINVAVVVTRYFGGIKLGAGGLIRAYAQSVANGIDTVGIVEGKLQKELFITIAYPLHGKLTNFLEAQQVYIKDTVFSENVMVTCLIDEAQTAAFQEQVLDVLSGQVSFSLGAAAYTETPILL